MWKGPGVLLLWIDLCWGHVRVLLAVLLKTDHNSSIKSFVLSAKRFIVRRNYASHSTRVLIQYCWWIEFSSMFSFNTLFCSFQSSCVKVSSVAQCLVLILFNLEISIPRKCALKRQSKALDIRFGNFHQDWRLQWE